MTIQRTLTHTAAIATAALTLTMATGQQAKAAFTLGNDGWNYAVGSFNSGTGGSIYELYSIAYKDAGDKMMVAINANMNYNQSSSNQITYGDLFFNFSNKSFAEASSAGNLYGVRFATKDSESGAAQTGVYSGVSAKAVGNVNSGWKNLTDYSNYVKSNNSYGDLNSKSSYFKGMDTGSYTIQNSISKGTFEGGLTMLAADLLKSSGLDFSVAGARINPGQAIGANTFGFSFAKPKDFSGNFMANLFLECGNDGLAISGNASAVPEPTTMAGIALAGGAMTMLRRRRAKQQKSQA
jgi:hypothetical protein